MTLANRLKAAPPHFVPHVKAPAPKIIMRRSSDLGKDRDPAPGVILRMIKSSPMGVRASSSPHSPSYPTLPAPLGERSRMRYSIPAVAKKALTLTRN